MPDPGTRWDFIDVELVDLNLPKRNSKNEYKWIWSSIAGFLITEFRDGGTTRDTDDVDIVLETVSSLEEEEQEGICLM